MNFNEMYRIAKTEISNHLLDTIMFYMTEYKNDLTYGETATAFEHAMTQVCDKLAWEMNYNDLAEEHGIKE